MKIFTLVIGSLVYILVLAAVLIFIRGASGPDTPEKQRRDIAEFDAFMRERRGRG